MEPVSIPDISGPERANKIGNILFWAGQAKYLVLLGGASSGTQTAFFALYGAQEAGLCLNFYANNALLRTYDRMGAEASFLRTGARSLYVVDKALTLGSLGLFAYGASHDRSKLAAIGGLGFVFTNLFDFYVWHQLSQSTAEARSGIRNWNTGVGLREGGLDLTITYSFL